MFLLQFLVPLAAAAPQSSLPKQVRSSDPGSIQNHANGQLQSRGLPNTDSNNDHPVWSPHFSKRANSSTYPQTNFTFGDSKLVWGCNIDPVATLGNFSSICPSSGSCIANEPHTQPILYTVPKTGSYTTGPVPESLVISAQGFYPADKQETVLQAVQTAVSANGLIQWDRGQKWASTVPPLSPRIDQPPPQQYKGTCDLATFSNYIGVDVWSSPTTIEAHLDITISLPDLDDGFCGALGMGILGLGAAIAGALDGEATLAAFLGIIGATCGVVSAASGQ